MEPELLTTPRENLDDDEPELDARLERIEALARFLDDAFEVPGTNFRVGWDTIIGLVPGIGDVATAALSGYLIREAQRMGVSKWTLARMIGNVTVDTVVGLVPGAGDVFDAAFKANRKNVELLRRALERKRERRNR